MKTPSSNPRLALFPAAVLLSLSLTSAQAVTPLTDLFNTGVDATGVPLTDNVPDPHYVFATPPPTGVTPLVATAAGGFPIPPWLGDNSTSAWITPMADTQGDAGDYVYRTTFTVPADIDPTQVFLRGVWASDNDGRGILLNGQSTGITNTRGFEAFSPQWTISTGFVVGLNTLDFVVNEASGSASGPGGGGGFTSLRVEMSGAHAGAGQIAIPGLKNSGVATAEGAPLPDDSVSPGITLGGAAIGDAIVTTAAGGFPIPPWAADSRESAWVTPGADTSGAEGDFTYTITFDLSGFDPSTVSILGRWAVDNVGSEILLNGTPTGNINLNGFADFTEFTLSPADGEQFLPGENTLTFLVNNGPGAGPTGVRWEFVSASVAVPEPGAGLLMTLGLATFAARRRRR